MTCRASATGVLPDGAGKAITNSEARRKQVTTAEATRGKSVINGIEVEWMERRFPSSARGSYTSEWREWTQTTRVYGAIDALVPEFAAEEPYQGFSIPRKPEDALNQMRSRIWNAWKNATTAETSRRLAPLLAVLNNRGLTVPVAACESKFSQKAGCTMCPCSPGMVLGERIQHDGRPVDLYLTRIESEQGK